MLCIRSLDYRFEKLVLGDNYILIVNEYNRRKLMRYHEVDYEIIGDDMQIGEIELDQGETVIAEAGAMNDMNDVILIEAKMGDGSKPKSGLLEKLLDVVK